MTRVPMFSNAVLAQKAGMGYYVSPAMQQRYPDIEFSQFIGAEMMAKKYGLSKAQLDQFALESSQRAIAATKAGAFNDEIMPLEVRRLDGAQAGAVHTADDGIRFDATTEAIASVTLLAQNGRVPAATARHN